VLSSLELLSKHVTCLFITDDGERLITTNEAVPRRAPRFYVGQCAEATITRYRTDVGVERIQALEDILAEYRNRPEASLPRSTIESELNKDAPVVRTWSGPAFHYPVREECFIPGIVYITQQNVGLLDEWFSDWREDVERSQPFLGILDSGKLAAVCGSVRHGFGADEAGVETAPECRGRGHAGSVVRAWANAVCKEGRLPLYSTSWDNAASIAVARKLGLIQYAVEVHVT
jgi:RimJ/RimL family protein N-acetyltransferase